MITRSILRCSLVVTTLSVVLVGCYSQVSIGTTVPEREAHIVAQLTDLGSERMAQQIGPAATEIEGIIAEATDSTWQVRLVRVDQRGGFSVPWNRELVTFPRSALTTVSQKRLDKTRSWIVAGGVTIGVLLIQKALGLFISDAAGKGPTEPPAS
jgi:hypothetical protein